MSLCIWTLAHVHMDTVKGMRQIWVWFCGGWMSLLKQGSPLNQSVFPVTPRYVF